MKKQWVDGNNLKFKLGNLNQGIFIKIATWKSNQQYFKINTGNSTPICKARKKSTRNKSF